MGQILRYKDFLKTYKTRSHRIKHLENYKWMFPITSSPMLAGIVADIICDGHLQGDPKWRIDFTSKNIRELKRFEKNIFFLFKVKGRIRKCVYNNLSKSYNIGINCSPVSRILFLCGVPSGEKVLKEFDIPDWIKKDKECFRTFCKRVFTCEGGLLNDGRKIPQIRMNIWKTEKLAKEEKFTGSLCRLMKEYFDIDSTLRLHKPRLNRKDKILTRPIRVYIFNKSVIKFFNKIGFEGEKQKSLKAILNSNLGDGCSP
jgi:hypothetical protein